MQKYEVRITSHAKESLRNIALYILNELHAPKAAENTMAVIRREMESLSLMPARIPLAPEEPWRSYGIHRFRVRNFYWEKSKRAIRDHAIWMKARCSAYRGKSGV